MKVALYTLTRERLEYTKHCFSVLREKAGHPFDHFVIDNGSEDGTREWLLENAKDFKAITTFSENKGISEGSNQALRMIYNQEEFSGEKYDLIIKMDNDCEVVTDNLLQRIVRIYETTIEFQPQYILSPRVVGINHQPSRNGQEVILGQYIGLTAIVGGLFHVVPRDIYKQFWYPLDTAKARGQDDAFCAWANSNGIRTGYIEELIVNHYETTDGQARRYPKYFERKWQEEKL